MSFIDLTKQRYSVRKFTTEPVRDADILTILSAAANAPTGCNNQPQRIYVVQSPEALAKLRPCTKCHFDAPLIFAITYDVKEAWVRSFDNKDCGEIDATIVATQMVYAAEELGLGSTFVAWFDPAKVAAALDLPEGRVPLLLLPVGHPAPDAAPGPMHASRKPLGETTIFL